MVHPCWYRVAEVVVAAVAVVAEEVAEVAEVAVAAEEAVEGGSGGSNGSTVSGDTVSAGVDGEEVPTELGEDEFSAPPQPAKPSTATSARNIPKHRDVNPPGKQRFFLLFKISISPLSASAYY